MTHKFYGFMSGLPRSGTTLLSSIVSQNKDVWITPQSDLYEHARNIVNTTPDFESFRLGVMHRESFSLLKNLIGAFYADAPQSYIIDKSRAWGTPYFLNILPSLLNGQTPKILCPVRPLAEVVASFIREANKNPGINFIDRDMTAKDFFSYWRKPIDDARVDWLLQPGGMLDTAILSVSSAFKSETEHFFHVFTYYDLVNEPSKTLDSIYDFLGLDMFIHDFTVIPPAEPHADAEVLGVPDLHTVRSTLAVTAPAPEDVLSDYALTRCQIEDFWTE